MAVLGNPKNTIEILQKYNFNFQKKFGTLNSPDCRKSSSE